MQLLCPKCHNIMAQYERNRVLVDQCTECKGIFLDRGELEKLAEAEKAFYGSPPPGPGAPVDDRPFDSRPDEGRRYDERPLGDQPYDTRSYGDRPYADRPYGDRPYSDRPHERDSRRDDRSYKKRKRSSMLEELFDF